MSLFSVLDSASNALAAFQSALSVTQNNIANASTPGYAKQTPTFEALPFEFATGEVGGVQAGAVQSSRDEYVEESVRSSTSQLGNYQGQVQSLTTLQSQFDISGKSGIPAALTNLYSAFSNWSTNPNDGTARQNVISSAQIIAGAFQSTASNVAQLTTNTNTQLSSMVDQVNALAGQLVTYNAQIASGNRNDPGIDAGIHNTLESLSALANVTAVIKSDGSVTALLGNDQTPLVSGATQNKLSVNFYVPTNPAPTNPLGPSSAKLVDSNGKNVTSEITSGQLAGVLNMKNQTLPAIQGDGYNNGSLNQLAKGFADRVNTLVGFPLFTYDSTNATDTAKSLQVSSTATAAQLPGPRVTALTGTAVTAPFAVTTGSNDSLNLQVDGKTWPAITLNPADTTLAAVASDLNSQFTTLGIGANASVTGTGSLVVTTANNGNTGSIAILSGSSNTTLGLTQTTPTYQNSASSTALSLASLANPASSADEIDGQSYTAYFGSIAAGVGSALSNAQT